MSRPLRTPQRYSGGVSTRKACNGLMYRGTDSSGAMSSRTTRMTAPATRSSVRIIRGSIPTRGKLSVLTNPGFTAVSGWVFRNNRWDYDFPVSVSAYSGVFAESLTLYGRGHYGEARTRDRSFATTLAFPLPTLQSLASPGEAFADILAHLIVDRRAATYLKPDVVTGFEGNVFPVLIDKGRRFRPADYDLF